MSQASPLEHQKIQSVTLVLRENSAESDDTKEVFLLEGLDIDDDRISSANSRVSVLHARDPIQFRMPADGTFYIAFLAAHRPLDILSSADPTFRKTALFGCGLCSIVLISKDSNWLRTTLSERQKDLYAWELWTIQSSKLVDQVRWTMQPTAKSHRRIVLQTGKVRDDSTIWLIQELSLNLNHFLEQAERCAPYVLDELLTLGNEINEVIAEIVSDEGIYFLAERDVEDSQHAPEHTETLLRQKKRLNTNVDLLVQLNSALVYAVGQALHGGVPLAHRGGHVSQHSLLGIGTAWRAIHRVCSTVFTVFRKSTFPENLRDRLEGVKVATPLSSQDPGGTSNSQNARLSAEDLSELRLNTRIVHFSARRGFGESDASITCPSQTLQVCSEPEWSLSTTTHEILHAHVRELIAAVLFEPASAETPLPQEESLARIISAYEKFSTAHPPASAPSPLQEVRYGLVEFALAYRNAVDKAKEKYQIAAPEFEVEEIIVTLPKEVEGTFRAFKKSFRLLEETIVHVLDLYYFYRADKALFCDAIWHSWSIVPSVIEKLDWYILRTLLALASTASGGVYQRLAQAAEILTDSLNRILRRGKGSVVAKEVLRRIDPLRQNPANERRDSPFFKWIDLLFPACLPLVDLTTKFFVSETLVREFSQPVDELVDTEGHYLIEPVDFAIKEVKNPVALICDRLRFGLEREGVRSISHDEVARRSAWLLVALSSPPKNSNSV